MTRQRFATLVASLAMAMACSERAPDIVDARGHPPLVDGGPAVAYLTLRNPTGRPLQIESAACPPFARVEIHETRVADGVSRMQRIAAPTVEAGGELALRPGGPHLMLMQPQSDIRAGDTCPLSLRLADGSELSATLQFTERTAGGPGQ